MSSLSRSLSPPPEEEELEIQTNQILEAKSPLGAIADLSLTAVVAPSDDVHKSNLRRLIVHFSHDLYEEEEGNDDAIEDLSLTAVVAPSDVHKSNLEHRDVCVHEHPLILYEEEEGNDDVVRRRFGGEEIICSVCCCPISEGPIYSCNNSSSSTECELFIIHKSCAELPDEIQSVFHSDHTLFLRRTACRRFEDKIKCVICNMYEKATFVYKCVLMYECEFSLHIKCALQYNVQDPQGHDHSFLLLKPTLFTCDACGVKREIECMSYLCTTCQLQVHLNCRSCDSPPFPLTVKQIRHPHELSLTYFSQSLRYSTMCMICCRWMNGVLLFYYCADCRFIAHATCALSKQLRDTYDADEELFNFFENGSFFPNLTTPTLAPGLIETKEIATELRHFSHPQHCLILSNDPKLNEVCDGCTMPISVPYYTCADHPECDFLLHKQCFELPRKIRHPLHNHELTLEAVNYWHGSPFGIFKCNWCHVMCDGFAYICDRCTFSIDVACSLVRDLFIHDGHGCELRLVDTLVNKKCNACGLDCLFIFACKRCDFYLHCHCASLPNTISHDCPKPEWGIRPYNLTFSSVDDGSGEYYCDICEERRDPNHWFYYCRNCDYSGHPQCLLGKHRIKLGRTYLLECHPHSLTLLKEAKDTGMRHPSCATCGDPCKDVGVFFCTECDIYIHNERECYDSIHNERKCFFI